MSPQTLAIVGNREVIAVDQDRLGKQGLPILKNETYEIWSKPLADGSINLRPEFNGGQPLTLDFELAGTTKPTTDKPSLEFDLGDDAPPDGPDGKRPK